MRAIPQAAVDFVAQHEGLRPLSYQDPGGVWTIGYGHTGPDVRAGVRITTEKAKSLLADDLKIAASRLQAVVKREVIESLTENQYAALLSFVYNCGADPKWTIWKRLNARDYEGVPGQMLRFVNAGGKRLEGLASRRSAEVALWRTAEPGTAQEAAPSSFVRQTITPAPEYKKPLFQSRTVIAGSAQAVTGISAGAYAVQQAVAPHANAAPVLAKVVAGLAIVLAACGVILLGIKWLEKREAQR